MVSPCTIRKSRIFFSYLVGGCHSMTESLVRADYIGITTVPLMKKCSLCIITRIALFDDGL